MNVNTKSRFRPALAQALDRLADILGHRRVADVLAGPRVPLERRPEPEIPYWVGP